MMFYASLSLLLAPRAPPPRMMGRGPSFSEGQRLFVDNLSFDTDWQALKGICGGSSASGQPAPGPERQRLKNSDKPSGS